MDNDAAGDLRNDAIFHDTHNHEVKILYSGLFARCFYGVNRPLDERRLMNNLGYGR